MAKIKLRRDTYTNWFNANPILSEGEPALDTTNNKVKYGNGLTPWKDLPYSDNTTSTYTLLPATESQLGGIKVGNGLLVTLDGTLSVSNSGGTYTLITATNSVLGGVKIGNGIAALGDGTISVKFPLNAGQSSIGQPVFGGNSDLITLYNFNDNARTNYAIGYETNYMWFGTEAALSGVGFKWYSGTDEILTLDSNGTIYMSDGTSTITSTKVSNWDSAYSWGNHALAGYLTTISQITITETDPIFSTSTAATITATNVSNWDTAYSWGNHATRGYTTASVGALTLTGNSIKGNDYTTGVLLDYSVDAYTLTNESEAGDYIYIPYNSTSSQITAGWIIAASNTTTTVAGTLYPMAGRDGMIRVNLTNPTSPDRVRYPLSIITPVFGPQVAEVVIQPSSTISNVKFVFSSSGVLYTPGSIIPDTDVAYDLGSPTYRFKDLYLSGSTLYLGDSVISSTAAGGIATPVDRPLGSWVVAYPDTGSSAGTFTLNYARTPGSTIYIHGGWQDSNYGGPGVPGPGGTFDFVEGDGNFTVEGKTLIITNSQQYQIMDCWEVYTLTGDSIAATTLTADTVDTTSISFPGATFRIVTVPTSSIGALGDIAGDMAFDGTYIYYCTTDYTDGVDDIWKRVAWSNDTW